MDYPLISEIFATATNGPSKQLQRKAEAINKNMDKKRKQGKFSCSKAIVGYEYLVKDAVKEYYKDYGYKAKMTKAERLETAKRIRDHYLEGWCK